MKLRAFAATLLCGCTAAQLDLNNPVVYVAGVYCPDQNGNAGPAYPWTRLVAGYACCADHGLGGGQCPETHSCMMPDSCTATPLPSNVGASKPAKRRGL